MKRKFIYLIMIFSVLAVLCAVNVAAANKTFTITVKDSNGNYLENIEISMRNDVSINTQITKYTDENGKATFTMYDGIEYGFNVYDSAHNNACIYSPNTYNTSTTVGGLIFTLVPASTTYTTYSDPIELTGGARLSSYYGYRFVSNDLDLHKGLDIAADSGTDIYSVADADYVDHGDDAVGRGYWVLYEISSSRYVLYQHMLNAFDTNNVDDPAEEGITVVGDVGNTGNSFGNHLHIEFLTSSSMNGTNTVDPLRYIYK